MLALLVIHITVLYIRHYDIIRNYTEQQLTRKFDQTHFIFYNSLFLIDYVFLMIMNLEFRDFIIIEHSDK